jgi:hypothetical protein
MRHRGVHRVVLGSAILWGIIGGPVLAQRADSLSQDARIRVQFDGPSRGWGRRMEGRVVRADGDTLLLRPADRAIVEVIPWSRVRRAEVYAGTRPAGTAFGRGALRGATVGAALGAGLIVAERVYARTRQCTNGATRSPCHPFSVGIDAIIVTSTTLWGAVIGGGVGLSHREQWTRVRHPR